MGDMRKVTFVVLSLLVMMPLLAQEPHKPGSIEELRARYWAGLTVDNLARITSSAAPTPLATKTFTIAAGSTNQNNFAFNVSPQPFTVNQGDTVVININVASND